MCTISNPKCRALFNNYIFFYAFLWKYFSDIVILLKHEKYEYVLNRKFGYDSIRWIYGTFHSVFHKRHLTDLYSCFEHIIILITEYIFYDVLESDWIWKVISFLCKHVVYWYDYDLYVNVNNNNSFSRRPSIKLIY